MQCSTACFSSTAHNSVCYGNTHKNKYNSNDVHGSTTWTRRGSQKVAFSHYFLCELLIRNLDSKPVEVNGKAPMRLAGFGSNPKHQSEYVHEAGTEHELKGREGTTLTLTGA